MQDLVLIPGLNNTAAVFDGVVSALPPQVRPHACTCPPLTSVEAIAQALQGDLPARFWLAGFSFGGYVALAMLERYPERVQGIALLCTSPFADTPAQQARRRQAMRTAREGGYGQMIEAQAANAFHPASLADARLMPARRAMVADYGADRFLAHMQAVIDRPDRSALLDGGIPVLVVAASHDNVFAAAALADYAARIPGASFQCIDEAGHLAPMEKPAAVAAALAAWMSAGRSCGS